MFRKRTMTDRRGIALAAAAAAGGLAFYYYALRPRYSFAGRVVLITGGSRGLGLLMARQWAQEGARLAILARDQDEVNRAVSDLQQRGAEVLGLRCDICDPKQVDQAVRQVIERFGGVDVLVNNAGIIQVGPLHHQGTEDFRHAMDVHFWAPLYLIEAVLPSMRARGQGRIVNIASIGGKIAVPHLAPYCASKFALVGLSDALRCELRREGILVTTVCPWLMRTGSPLNALFKGRHRQEFTWFVISDSLPLVSMSAERSASKIVEACRRGDAQLVLALKGKLAVLANAAVPGLVAAGMSFMNRLLPKASLEHGKETHPGRDSQSRWLPSFLTRLSQTAAEKNNELPRPKPAPSPPMASQVGIGGEAI